MRSKYNLGDLFIKNDTVHIVTKLVNGYIDEAITLKDYVERSFMVRSLHDETQMITIKELIDEISNKIIYEKGIK